MKLIKDLFKNAAVPVFVEIRGRERLLAQGYCRICEYSPERIGLANGEYIISVYGSGLELTHLSEDVIAIDGRIDGIEFI